ncbi:MAG: hypothetical protein AAF841_09125 [Pseudomonadota bacterium]
MILAATFIIPGLIAIGWGVRGYRDRPRTTAEYALGAMWSFLFATAFIFAWHALWLGAAAMATGLAQGLLIGTVFNSAVSAVIWFPLLMISYTFNAQRGRRDDT